MIGLIFLPSLIALTLILVHLAHEATGASYLPVLLVVLFFMWLSERLAPLKKAVLTRAHVITDLIFIVINPLLMPLLWYVAVKKVVPFEFDPFNVISSTPLIPQVLLFFLGSEFFRYWAHRFQHEKPQLWKFHAVHHCMPQMYYLNQFISHPVDYFLRNVITLTPLMLFKFDPWAIAYSQGISTLMGMMGHANLNVKNGWWNYVFPTYEIHRWHHSTVPFESNANYGVGTLLWDHVFGTFRKTPSEAPQEVGIDDETYVIHDWKGLMKRPFKN
jgi:sterol desaturase/sphingolipid hydroxylase (fatty acid hydroxylase superfamily)